MARHGGDNRKHKGPGNKLHHQKAVNQRITGLPMKNKVRISERTYRRYKKEILKQQNMLEDYAWNNVQIEQVRKIETKKSILHHCWDLFEKAEKIPEKLSLLKTIEKISDELPKIVWSANTFGDNMERIEEYRKEKEEEESRKKRYLENLDSEDEESGQILGTK